MKTHTEQLSNLLNKPNYKQSEWDILISDCIKQNNISFAISSLQQAHNKYGNLYEIFWTSALCALKSKKIEDYEHFLIKCTQMETGNCECFLLLGELEYKKQNQNKMNEYFFKAIALSPSILSASYYHSAPPFLKNALILNKNNYNYKQQLNANEILSDLQLQGDIARLQKCFQILLGQLKPEKPNNFKPDMLFFPDIRIQPFYDYLEFPYLNPLIENQDSIKREFENIKSPLNNYINLHGNTDDLELPQFKDIENQTWKSFHLYRFGKLEENCKSCPVTTQVLEKIGMPAAGNFMPEAFFSKLGKHSVIPEHYGLSNIRLAVHWPIIVNDDCFIEVGGVKKSWQLGQPMIFDDSFLHQAQNNSDKDRVVLIFDMWHPDLTELEIEGLKRMLDWAQPN